MNEPLDAPATSGSPPVPGTLQGPALSSSLGGSAHMGATAAGAPVTTPASASSFWTTVDRWTLTGSELLNPILVKEARQSLKSRQFSITFTLVLLLGWGWSILGLAMFAYSMEMRPIGREMFVGYLWILAFPLLVIVPFGAFRSLASEYEDGTQELLSITTLRPWQIVLGKLVSAMLQMMVYFSAMAPCIAFTYLLRGIDIVTILWILAHAALISLGLSLVGLFLATITHERHWQTVLAVFLALGLGAAYLFCSIMGTVFVSETVLEFDQPYFWPVNAAVVVVYLGCFYLLLTVATSALSFVSDNRSTRIRVAMLTLQTLIVGVTFYLGAELGGASGDDRGGFLATGAILLMMHWYLMGTFMTGESGELSPRVKRELPKSLAGRALFTWFNPGPGTGFVFAISNLFASLLIMGIGFAIYNQYPFRFGSITTTDRALTTYAFLILGFCYVACYLSLGRLVLRLLKRWFYIGPPASLLVQALLVSFIGIGSFAIGAAVTMDLGNYTLVEFFSPLRTMTDLMSYSGMDIGTMWGVLGIMVVLTIVGCVIQLPTIAAEVSHVRIAAPARVAEEVARIEAELHPSLPVRHSPWD